MKKYILQKSPFIVPTSDGKLIEEHHGLATTQPFQTPKFDEYTYIMKGKKQFIIEDEVVILEAGQSIKIEKNTRIQYSNPFNEPCEYLAICSPAFSMDLVNRED